MKLHCQAFIINLSKFSDQKATQIQRWAVLLVLYVSCLLFTYQIQQIGKLDLKTLGKEDQFRCLSPFDVLFAHFNLQLCVNVHLHSNLHHRFHYT